MFSSLSFSDSVSFVEPLSQQLFTASWIMSSRSRTDNSLCFFSFNRWWSNRGNHLLQSCFLLRHYKYTINSLCIFKLLLSSYLCWVLRCLLSLSLIMLYILDICKDTRSVQHNLFSLLHLTPLSIPSLGALLYIRFASLGEPPLCFLNSQ